MTDERLWAWVQRELDYDDFAGMTSSAQIADAIIQKGDPSSSHFPGFKAAIESGGSSISEHLGQIADVQRSISDFDDTSEINNLLAKLDALDTRAEVGGSKLKNVHLDAIKDRMKEVTATRIGRASDTDSVEAIRDEISTQLRGVSGLRDELDAAEAEAEAKLGEIITKEEEIAARRESLGEATTRLKAAQSEGEVDTIVDDILSRDEFQDLTTKRAQSMVDAVRERADVRKGMLG
jgi:hypothetical protein